MSFIVAACVLLVALLAGIFVDGSGARRRHHKRDDVPPFDAW